MTYELKTKENDSDVEAFLHTVADERRRNDSLALLELMKEVTGEEPKMWGPAIVGFGRYHYKYASGHEGDMPMAGFSPRKQNLTLYLMMDFDGFDDLRGRLGKHKVSKACLYINKLSDVDQAVLREMVRQSYDRMRESHN